MIIYVCICIHICVYPVSRVALEGDSSARGLPWMVQVAAASALELRTFRVVDTPGLSVGMPRI